MSVNVQPLDEYVLAVQEDASNKTASGLFLPDNATEKPKIAKVLAVGKKVEEIKVNDRIIYKGYSTTEVKVENKDYILVKEEDVLAKIK